MEEGKSSLLTGYEPIDVTSIKASKIHSEKELENECNTMCEFLKDISNILLFC
jgi:hypothetical protein